MLNTSAYMRIVADCAIDASESYPHMLKVRGNPNRESIFTKTNRPAAGRIYKYYTGNIKKAKPCGMGCLPYVWF